MKRIGCALVALSALALVVSASAATPLTKTQYIAKLRAADAAASKAENAAVASLQAKTTTAAQVKARFIAMGKTQVRIGDSFATIVPPKAATKANRDFSRAEITLGRQNETIGKGLPATKPAILKYVQSLEPPSGGKMLDRAIAELHAAGFKT